MTEPDTPDVVGAEEAAAILGVELGRISRWRKANRLPLPYSEPLCSPVWWRSDIEAFRDAGMEVREGSYHEPPRQMAWLGTAEVAEMLGVDKSQIGRWRRNPPRTGAQLPEPFTRIKAGPLWHRADIIQFSRARKRAA